MKTIMAIMAISLVTISIFAATLQALDRSIYKGCEVVRQEGNTLYVKLNKELCTGTDMACVQAEQVLDAIHANGYRTVVVREPGQWAPFSK